MKPCSGADESCLVDAAPVSSSHRPNLEWCCDSGRRRPVVIDPNGPTGIGEKVVLFGDMSRYFIRDAGGVRFERSDDYAFANDLVRFRALLRTGGCSNHEHTAGVVPTVGAHLGRPVVCSPWAT